MEKFFLISLLVISGCAAVIGFLSKKLRQAEMTARSEVRRTEERYRALFEFTREGLITTDAEDRILNANSAAAEMLGFESPDDLSGRAITEFYLYPEQRKPLHDDLVKNGYMENYLLTLKKKDCSLLYVIGSEIIRRDNCGYITAIDASYMSITRQKKAEDDAREAQAEARFCNEEKTAFINAMRMVLRHDDFTASAMDIFNSCRGLVGASSGYVALLDENGKGDKVLAADPADAVPLTAAHAEIYRTSKPVYANDLSKSEWVGELPENLRPLNLLMTPLIIKSGISGVLCLLNKPKGFNGNDARIAFIFGEIIAIAKKLYLK